VTGPLSSLSAAELAGALEGCGLTPDTVHTIMERAPFADDDALCTTVDHVILELDEADLKAALEQVPAPAVERENRDAHDAALFAIRLYSDRFGYPFVSGIETPTSEELLMRVRIRLGNDPEPEGRAAREHLRRLVRRRIQSLQEAAGG
jgi:2-oxo-4-hydroxy-4-carboxy-5-ureidoimidazoline decarboxylase